jgi:hypothetical protein
LLEPSAGRDGDERAMREKRTRFRGKSHAKQKGLEQDSIHFKSDPALSVLTPDAGEFAANYQDAVKGVLTVRRPATRAAPSGP